VRQGYRPSGTECTPCPKGAVSWFLIALVGIVLLGVVVLVVYIIVKSGDDILLEGKQTELGTPAGGGSAGAPALDARAIAEAELDFEDAGVDLDAYMQQGDEVESRASDAAIGPPAGSPLDALQPPNAAANATSPSSAQGPLPPPAAPPAPLPPPPASAGPAVAGSGFGAALSADDEYARAVKFDADDFLPEDEEGDRDAPVDVAHERSLEDEELLAMVSKIGPPPPVSVFTHKFKIFVTFLQICFNFISRLDFTWPSLYRQVIAYLGFSNLDYIFQNVTGADCVSQDNYYYFTVAICVFPIIICLVGFLVWVLPREMGYVGLFSSGGFERAFACSFCHLDDSLVALTERPNLVCLSLCASYHTQLALLPPRVAAGAAHL
jgi:hypothetical protein